MKKVELKADNRTGSGSKQSKKLKKENCIPAILYVRALPEGCSRLMRVNLIILLLKTVRML
mgnify:CR=1 FL=1